MLATDETTALAHCTLDNDGQKYTRSQHVMLATDETTALAHCTLDN